MNSERKMYYEHNKSIYKNDVETIKELDYLWNNFPQYDFYKFTPGFYNQENIENYGFYNVNKAAKNFKYGLLEYGLTSYDNLAKVELYLNTNLFKMDENIIISDILSNEDLLVLNKLLDDFDYMEIFSLTNKDEDIKRLKQIIYDEDILNNIKFLGSHLNMHFISDEFYSIISSKEFTQFINSIDDNYMTTEDTINSVMKMYNIYKNISFNLKKLDKKILNDYLFNQNYLEYNIDSNKNYYEQKYLTVVDYIKEFDILKNKEIISNLYFNRNYNQVMDILNDGKTLLKKYNLYDDAFENLYLLIDLKTNEELIDYIKIIKYQSNLGFELVELTKKISKTDMVDKLNCIYIVKNNDILKLSGEQFYMLVHKIKGFGNKDFAEKLYNDPSYWISEKDENSYISTSAINNEYLGMTEGYGYVLGFQNIKAKDILSMGPVDIYTDRKIIKNNLNNTKARFMESDDLINNTKEMYNEVVLKRYQGETPLMPNYVVTTDNITNKDKEVSNYFDIPIIEIDSKCYAKKLIEKYNYLINKNKFQEASVLLLKLVKGFYSCELEYLNYQTLESNIKDIVYNCINSKNVTKEELQELIQLVNICDSVIEILSHKDNTYYEFDSKELIKIIQSKK